LVTVNIPDPQSGPDGVAYGTSTIADAPLTATSQDFTIQLGKPWTNQVVASFTDANPKEAPAAYAAGIYWGDSNTPQAGKVVSLGGRFLVIGSRGYFNPGVFRYRVVIRDNLLGDDWSTALTAGTARVTPYGEGQPINPTAFGSFIDQRDTIGGSQDLDGDFVNTSIDWGDRTSSVATVTAGQVLGSHTYNEENDAYPLTAQVVDHFETYRKNLKLAVADAMLTP